MKNKISYIFLLLFGGILFLSCSQVSPTVDPADIISTYFTSPPGTTRMQSSLAYPVNGSLTVPVDANIVLVFTKNVNAATVAANISINAGAVTYTSTTSNNIVTIVPTVLLSASTAYTVTVSTGLLATSGEALDVLYTYNFSTAAASTATNPAVVALTQYPADLSTGISRNIGYVEVTFTKPVLNVTAGTFTISGGAASGAPTQIAGTNTYKLPLNTLSYLTWYTVTLTGGITDASGNALTGAPVTWAFRTEPDPNSVGANPTALSNIGIASVSDSQAIICFNTDVPTNYTKVKIEYSTSSTLAGSTTVVETAWDAATPSGNYMNHGVIVPGLTANTLYYYRVCADAPAACSLTDNAAPPYKTFYTAATAGVGNTAMTTSATSPNTMKVIQLDDGSAYVFWLENNANVKGQFFNTAGIAQWAAGGVTINNTGSTIGIVDSFFVTKVPSMAPVVTNDVLVIYKINTNALYARKIYNSGGTATDRWAGEVSLGITVKAGSYYSADLVHYTPKMRGTAIKPLAGYPANILFDKDVNLNASGLANNDLILWNNAGWNIGVVYNTNSWNIYNYILRSDQNINLTSVNYYVASPTSSIASTVTSYNAPLKELVYSYATNTPMTGNILYDSTQVKYAVIVSDTVTGVGPYTHTLILDTNISAVAADAITIYLNSGSIFSYTAGTKTLVFDNAAGAFSAGDLLYDSTVSKYAVIVSDSVVGNTHTIVLDVDISAAFGDYVYINTRKIGPLTSEAISNPLWDNTPYIPPATASIFTGNVAIGDFVLTPSSSTTIGSIINDYALQLSADIMSNGDAYYIFSTEASGTTYVVGATSSGVTLNNFMLHTAAATFMTVQQGDIVYNITDNTSAGVVNVISNTQLELTANIFTAVSKNFVIYRKGVFMVAYIDAADDVIAMKFDLSNGTAIGGALTITAGTFTNPHILSDGSGNAMFFYEGAGNIYSRKTDIMGNSIWASAAVLAGYTIKQVLPDYRTDAAYQGAYILGSSATQFVIGRTTTAGTMAAYPNTAAPVTGTSPFMAIDKNYSNNGADIVAAYLNTHTVGTTDYTHIMAWGIDISTSSNSFAAAATTNNTTAAYFCKYPYVSVSDTQNTAYNNFYITWFDGRYYSGVGYQVYSQRFSAAGVKQWATDIFSATPTTFGLAGQLELAVPVYASGAPYGIIPIWIDYRTNVTSTNLYFQKVDQTGTLQP
jgi:hypothetical protein